MIFGNSEIPLGKKFILFLSVLKTKLMSTKKAEISYLKTQNHDLPCVRCAHYGNAI